MAQTYHTIGAADTLSASRVKIQENDDAQKSSFSGTAVPSSPAPVAGQLFFDTDTPAAGSLNIYDGSAWRVVLPSCDVNGGGLLLKSGGTMTGGIAMGTQKVTGLGTGTSAADATTKAQVDAKELAVVMYIGDVAATTNRNFWLGGPAMTVTSIALTTQTTHATHASNHWTFQVENKTQTEDLYATAKTTNSSGGTAITADTTYNLGTLQNADIAANDVLQLTVTKGSSAVDLDELVVLMTYTVAV